MEIGAYILLYYALVLGTKYAHLRTLLLTYRLMRNTGAQNPSFVVFGFFIESYSTLHLLQHTFYSIKISCL